MSLPKRVLSPGEEVVHDLHPHWKTMLLPVLALIVIVGVASYAFFAVPAGEYRSVARYAVLAVALVGLIWLVGWPYLKWRTTNYVLTNRRLVTRSGVFSRSGRDVPLHRVNDVTFEHSFLDRLLRCGTLVIESAGERGQVTLRDVPQVEDVQREVYRLIEQEDLRRRRFGDDRDEIAYGRAREGDR